MSRIDELKAQIAQIDTLIAEGTLTGEAAHLARQKLEQELLTQVVQGGGAAAAVATAAEPPAPSVEAVAAAAPASVGLGAAAVLSPPAATQAALPAEPEPVRPSRSMVAGLAAFVLLFGVVGYAWLGNREGLSIGPGAGAAAAAASAPPSAEQIDALLARLAQRLKEKPDDADGWAMLGRSYSLLGRFDEAVPAFQRVIALRPQDAQGYADYADALGSAMGGKLDGEPEQLIAKALQIDPSNLKALALAGSIAFNRNDPAGAVKLWEQALRLSEPGGEMARQLQGVIDEARQRAGMRPSAVAAASAPGTAPAAAPAQAQVPTQTTASTTATAASAVQGRISLSAGLKAQASPDDTLFVFARPAQGAKMPLAILRKQVKDLPLEFTLDDSLAMSPAAKLSSAGQVIVGARISKSGNAMPQPGDLQGFSAPVAVGTRGVQLEIAETVR